MRTYKKIALATVLIVSGISAVMAVNAQEEKPESILPETSISLVQAVEIAQQGNDGMVTSAVLEILTDEPFYSIMIESDTTESEILVDADSGEVVGKLSMEGKNEEIMTYLTESNFGYADTDDMGMYDDLEDLEDLIMILDDIAESDDPELVAEIEALEACFEEQALSSDEAASDSESVTTTQ